MYRFEHDDCNFSQNKSQGLEVELLVITQHLKKRLNKNPQFSKLRDSNKFYQLTVRNRPKENRMTVRSSVSTLKCKKEAVFGENDK